MKKDFNEYRFEGLNPQKYSNNYITMNRVSDNKEKIVVRVGDDHLEKTLYGYALVLDKTRVVFLKDWQVSQNYYGNEVLLDKNYFIVKTWGNHDKFLDSDEDLTFEAWLEAAELQKETEVKWENNSKKDFKRILYGY